MASAPIRPQNKAPTTRGRRAQIGLVLLVGLWVLGIAGCEPVKRGLPPPGPNAVEVTLTTEPAGATIVVDGIPLGAGPVKAKLNPGMHKLKATKSGYFPADQQISLSSADKNKQIQLTLVASH